MKDIKKYKFNEDIIYKQHENIILAFNQDTADTFEFDEVGSDIFKLLSDNTSFDDLIRELKNNYGNEFEMEIRNDVNQFLIRMENLGIIYYE